MSMNSACTWATATAAPRGSSPPPRTPNSLRPEHNNASMETRHEK